MFDLIQSNWAILRDSRESDHSKLHIDPITEPVLWRERMISIFSIYLYVYWPIICEGRRWYHVHFSEILDFNESLMGLMTVVINALCAHVKYVTFPVFSFVFIHSYPKLSCKRRDIEIMTILVEKLPIICLDCRLFLFRRTGFRQWTG